MLEWRKNTFENLRHAASSAKSLGRWPDYARFCLEYERGLRPKAFATLDEFIYKLEREVFAERRAFVDWLLSLAYGLDGRKQLIPFQLQTRVIEPTLLEWTQIEPNCAEPHRWLGDREHLEKALELDPTDQIAIRELIRSIMSYIAFATHELPRGYLGSAKEDLSLVKRAEALLGGLKDKEQRELLASFITEEKAAINEYLRER
jgi:hypothetical protein